MKERVWDEISFFLSDAPLSIANGVGIHVTQIFVAQLGYSPLSSSDDEELNEWKS